MFDTETKSFDSSENTDHGSLMSPETVTIPETQLTQVLSHANDINDVKQREDASLESTSTAFDMSFLTGSSSQNDTSILMRYGLAEGMKNNNHQQRMRNVKNNDNHENNNNIDNKVNENEDEDAKKESQSHEERIAEEDINVNNIPVTETRKIPAEPPSFKHGKAKRQAKRQKGSNIHLYIFISIV